MGRPSRGKNDIASDGHKFRSLKKALGIFSTVVFPCSRDEPKQTSIFIECHSGYAPKQKATDIVAEETARVHGMGVPWNGVLPARLKEQEQLTYCKTGGDVVHISEYTHLSSGKLSEAFGSVD